MIEKIKRYFTEVKLEWGKVTKPPYNEIRGSTVVVIASTAILVAYLWFFDLILGRLRTLFLG